MPIIAGTDMKIADTLINGLPARKFMNQTFMIMAIAKVLDGAIINPPDSTSRWTPLLFG